MFEFFEEPRLVYGDGATFIRHCAKCCRFVKAPETMTFGSDGRYIEEDNAICSQCGSTHLIFEGFF